MKLAQKFINHFLSGLLAISMALLFAACSGGGTTGGGSSGGGTSGGGGTFTTTVAGRVTVSSSVSGGKPALLKAMLNAPKGKPGSKAYKASLKASSPLKSATLAPALSTIAFADADVYLYNADHPEWLCPVATGKTATDGSYSLSKLTGSLSTGQTYAACNGGVYNDGDDIPAGNYTLMAFKAGGFDPLLGKTTNTLVAVQTIVNSFSGTVTLSDMEAQEGTSYPTVAAMIGAKQNTDGTQTWGSATTTLPANAAIQVSFSAAMSRGSLTNGISISPAVSGKWALSADWTTATFYPDAGVTLTPGTVYTVTVKGADSANAVRNVYANALAKTATGTFTATAADSAAPTAEWESPTTLEMASAVDVTKPIRIRSNKQLDVNGLTLDGKVGGVSSLGAKPGVLYVGKNTAGYFVYEFVLGVPLKLNTTYDLSVSGGKGLNGIAMAQLNGSLITQSTTVGVDATATPETQVAQAAVKDVFGKWIRAFSDRNITQLQSLMSGDFYFEDLNTDPKSDLNHDGRLNLGEFSGMMSNQVFPQWEYCGATITGDVIGTINVVGNNADFEFKMNAATTNTSANCVGTVPTDSFYVTAQNVNGAWTVVRTSVGIDTRTKTINFPNLIDGLKITQGTSTITDGGQIQLPMYNPLTFSWSATTGVSSYVVLGIDARNPEHGVACALPTTTTSFDPNTGCMSGVDVSSKFGFATSTMATPGPFWVEGGQYYWEVIGLGTITATSTSIGSTSKTPLDIMKDITAISRLQSVNVAGVYKEITAQVYGATATPVTYSVNFDGYDVGAANQATITVTTANINATSGDLNVSGNFSKSYPLTFINGVATVTVDLSTGRNWINVSDWLGLNKSFSIITTGGIPKTVAINTITDQAGTALSLDSWNYVKATGATKVTITGSVTNANITAVDVNVWNDASGASSYVSAPVTGGTFSVTLDIYNGDNWINVGSGYSVTDPISGLSSWVWYGDNAGVYTDTGTVWVPNISLTAVTTATSTGSYGNSSDWDASSDSDGIVTITGKFKNPVNGSYNINSDGGWSNGTLTVALDGSFSLDVALYQGWNYVSFNDADYNWYGVNIYTTNGKLVVKPTIATVNDVAPVVPQYGGSGAVSTSACTATVTGTATAGNLNVNWNGYDGTSYYYESQNLTLSGAAETPIAFSFSVPLVSGGHNNIDVYDASYKWTGVQVTTSTNCAYAAPAMTLGAVLDSAGTTLVYDNMLNVYDAGASPSITLSGTSNRAGRSITVSTSACTAKNYYATASSTANASGTYDWLVNIPVYEGYNYPSISDGANGYYPTITTTNGMRAPAVLTASVSPGTVTLIGDCGYQEWDVGNVTSVNITGTTTAPDGTGNYTDAAGTNQTFTISGGAYTIANVPVYDGWNSIFLHDSATNSQSVYISAANGTIKPKFVDITAPLNTDAFAFVTGPQTVSGTMLDPTISGYKPPVVRASVAVYDNATISYTYTYYSSDPNDQLNGDLPLIYNGDGTFSFGADFGNGGPATVVVSGYDNLLLTYHSMTKYYNDGISGSNGSTVYYKPGTKTKAVVGNPAVEYELMKRRLMSINRNR